MKLGVLTDIHLAPPGVNGGGWHNPYAFARGASLLSEALAALAADGVDALAVLGDVANGGDAPSLDRGVRLIADAGLPTWVTTGNHDREERDDLLASTVLAAGPSLRMARPAGESLREGVRVAGVAVASPGGAPPWYLDRLPIDDWDGEPVLLLSHFPLLSREAACSTAGLRYVEGYEDRHGLAAALAERRAPTVVLHGHIHVRDAVAEGSLLQIGCAALIEPPHERVVVDLTPEPDALVVRVRHLPVIASPPVRLPVLSPASSDWTFRDGRWIGSAGT